MMNSSASTGLQFQGTDYFIRLSAAALADIRFTHLFTLPDETLLQDVPALRACQNCSAGSTEWVAHTGDSMLSLAWDWVYLGDDGSARALQIVAPRSNLKVVDSRGYDLNREDADAFLWSHIARIDWQPHVLPAIRPAPLHRVLN